ncbi:MAG: CAP domain-containing protein [Lutibacter sp.]|nr:CAP domain-containing protein [Lutibacter sp.]
MSKLIGKMLLTAFLISTMTACVKEDQPIIDDASVQYSDFETEVMNQVNNYRNSIGLEKLSRLNLVSTEAETHSVYMLNKQTLSHDNFDIRTQNLMNNASAISIAENVAYGYKTAEELLNSWLNSPEHRRKIEEKRYTDFGISAKNNSGGSYYVTQIFIERK